MNRIDYLNYLSHKLRRLPKEDYDRAMEYFEEYFEEAGPEHEREAIENLGSPDLAANQIIMEAAAQRTVEPRQNIKTGISTIWVVILAIFAAPIALPLAFAGVMVVASLLLAIVCLIFAGICTVGGSVFAVIGGIVLIASSPFDGVATIGVGLIGVGIGILLCYGFVKLGKLCLRKISKRFTKLAKRGKHYEDK